MLQGKYFDIIDGIIHHENPLYPGRWCVVVPGKRRDGLIGEDHDGHFCGSFCREKDLQIIWRRYWWPRMRADVRQYCRSCLVCALTKGNGSEIRPALQTIPVGGPFHIIGVDVLQLPLTLDGNQYAVIFIDYLPKVG